MYNIGAFRLKGQGCGAYHSVHCPLSIFISYGSRRRWRRTQHLFFAANFHVKRLSCPGYKYLLVEPLRIDAFAKLDVEIPDQPSHNESWLKGAQTIDCQPIHGDARVFGFTSCQCSCDVRMRKVGILLSHPAQILGRRATSRGYTRLGIENSLENDTRHAC